MNRRGVIVVVNSESRSWHFFRGQLAVFVQAGWEVHTISAPGAELDETQMQGAVPHTLTIQRTIAPFRDSLAVFRLALKLVTLRPSLVHAHTTKAALIAMLAAYLARVPVRIYHNHGMAALSCKGWRRLLLRGAERVANALATHTVYVAPSVREIAIKERLVKAEKSSTILSINGLDTDNQFNPENYVATRHRLREELGIPPNAFVLGYVGRLLLIKGIVELVTAWAQIKVRQPNVHLLVVGEYDYKDPLPQWVRTFLESDASITMTGHVQNTANYFAVMDAAVLPSYHEGLGYVLIEAQAMSVPCIATRVPGTVDALIDGETGVLIPPMDPNSIVAAVEAYVRDPEMRGVHARAGRAFASKSFNQQQVWARQLTLYEELTGQEQ